MITSILEKKRGKRLDINGPIYAIWTNRLFNVCDNEYLFNYMYMNYRKIKNFSYITQCL